MSYRPRNTRVITMHATKTEKEDKNRNKNNNKK